VVEKAAGNLEAAAGYYRRMLERDPLAALGYQNLGHVLGLAGRHEEAIPALHRALEMAPQSAGCRWMLAYSLAALGRLDEALAESEKDEAEVFRLAGSSMVLWLMGRREESDRRLKDLIDRWAGVAAAQIAETYAMRKDADEAFRWLERGIEDRDGGVMEARGMPLYAFLHSDPRWAEFLARMNYGD